MPTLIHRQVAIEFGLLEVVCDEGSAITIADAPDIFPVSAHVFERTSDAVETVQEICDLMRDVCELKGSHEHLFLLLYFNRVVEKLKAGSGFRSALLPMPKASFSMNGAALSVVADFAFWTGHRFVAVFIQDNSFDPHWKAKEGLLKVWGFDVFCLQPDEFETRGLMGGTGTKMLEALWLR